MKHSPFIYGNTVSNFAFTNREDELLRLKTNLLNGINTMIISPRRWGKSSLVEKATQEIIKEHKDVRIVLIDLFSISTEEEFLETFATQVIKASSSAWEEWLAAGKDFFKALTPKLSVGLDPFNDFSLSFDWDDLKKNGAEILNLPEQIGKKKNIQFIVCLDEFQNISNFDEKSDLEKKLRAHWQRHKWVTYCLYGSKRHMMMDIFNNSSKPFYRFGDIMLLPKIRPDKWQQFIVEGFKKTGKEISEANALRLCNHMQNHSWYVQQLAHYTWNLTAKKAGIQEINKAISELIEANSPLYILQIESLSTSQINLLKAITEGNRQLTSAQVMNRYRLGTPRNVTKNISMLNNRDIIHVVNGKLEFLDPAFLLWFNANYFNQSFLLNN